MRAATEVDYLVEATRSSVKRFGGDGPTLSHLAYVLSDKWSKEFVEVFGESGPSDVKELLARKSFVGDESDVQALLARSDDETKVLSELHDRLKSLIESAQSSEPETAAAAESAATGETQAAEPDGQSTTTPESGPAVEQFAWPERTRRFLTAVEPRADLLERDDEVIQLASVLSRSRRRIPIILGAPGSGRSSLVGGLVRTLDARTEAPAHTVLRVAPETTGLEPQGPLSRIIDDCESPTILVIDDVDRLAALGTARPNGAVLQLLRTVAGHPHLRIVLVCEDKYFRRLEQHAEDLIAELVPIRLRGLSESAVREIAARAVHSIEADHAVTISAELQSLASLPARSIDEAAHPGLALDRMDAAASRASVLGDSRAEVAHLTGFTSFSSRPMRTQDLESQLSRRVRGQEGAVRVVASRLALTLARLDLRPERPDGVFLFVGPTGVGKTELARAMATTLFGGEDRLIRLDMSEYSHDWAVSRLVGPMPGFVGSTEPENWLTTKVIEMPECVVLLDEIEKANPVVWNTFLQVFDAGRLTDSRGATADFSNAVIVMTSNLGAAAAAAPALGFGDGTADVDRARERITRAVKEAMAPELVNRIDELVVFDALSIAAIEDIARAELAGVCQRLTESGWTVDYEPDVVKHLVATGYDPAYGARHLQRNIERLFLGLIARAGTRAVSIGVTGGELVIRGDA